MALFDKTVNKLVWKGGARNHPERAHIVSIDSYSSTTGIPVYADHQYELVTTYNNPTAGNIDAMAVMRIFVERTGDTPNL